MLGLVAHLFLAEDEDAIRVGAFFSSSSFVFIQIHEVIATDQRYAHRAHLRHFAKFRQRGDVVRDGLFFLHLLWYEAHNRPSHVGIAGENSRSAILLYIKTASCKSCTMLEVCT